ncbi:MAG: serine/threonine-protein phosphatase [Clostridiales bacterium]|nr:serine/threonine-protein phosphatase [Clostridiales bacterium]
MKFLTAAYSDVGIRKKTNQDALMVKIADTDYGEVCFAVVCDGMGGLSRGELASATLIRLLSKWFEQEFPELLYGGISPEYLRRNWEQLIYETNYRIGSYSSQNQVRLGTTVAALLLTGNMYYIINVGDSRVYGLSDRVYQLTKDQTVVQREIDLGNLRPEDAERDPRRNVLLQCVGASSVIDPEFVFGEVGSGSNFLLCSDGFRHVVSNEEIYAKLGPAAAGSEQEMEENLRYIVELDKHRREEDNISGVLIHVM